MNKAVREQGDGAVIHGNAGRHPANATGEGSRDRIIALKKSELYRKANFTHFGELLAEHEQIQVSYTTLSRMLKGAGITSPKTRLSAAGERRTMGARRGILRPFGRFYRIMLNGITTMEQANAALPRFIAEFNQRFHRVFVQRKDRL